MSNQVVRQGRTGQSLGKKWVGIAVIEESIGRPLGPSLALARWGVQLTINLVVSPVGYPGPAGQHVAPLGRRTSNPARQGRSIGRCPDSSLNRSNLVRHSHCSG
ncbi:RDD family protein [Nocardia sp. CA-107356]|uniref:RDD family protein n=1 Tax=Nocardia sp. CA-107356 TaxID=3239972 RepID=UPI003D8D5971